MSDWAQLANDIENDKPVENQNHVKFAPEVLTKDERSNASAFQIQQQSTDSAGNVHYLDTMQGNIYNISDKKGDKKVPFSSFGLHPDILKGIYDMGYNTPSKIQETCIPLLISDPPQNMIAQSQSGTGKTATYVITMLSRVDPALAVTQCICLAPTYELALQIGSVCEKMSKFMNNVVIGYALRGVESPPANVPLNAQVVIATPGKLIEYVFKRNVIDFANVRVFVLDEADVMISQQGHRDQSLRLKMRLSEQTQMLLFSATYDDIVSQFATTVVPNAVVLRLHREQESLQNIQHFYFECNSLEDKFDVLLRIYGTITIGQAIIFCRTRNNASWLSEKLHQQGLMSELLSGELDVSQRALVIEKFRLARIRILVTTNVSARGLDVEQVTMVVNFDLPIDFETKQADFETYLHRVGRTGRFGKKGIAINMIDSERNLSIQGEISRHFNIEITKMDVDDIEAIERIEPNYVPHI